MEKYYPQVGEHLYLRQQTGNYYVDMVKTPYTVVEVTNTKVVVRECRLVAPIHQGPDRMDLIGQRVWFYNTIAESMYDDVNGRIKELSWAPKKGRWQHKSYSGDTYPEFAVFGEWKHQPYLD